MCFWKSEKSKVLRAKRDIVVYKIGHIADKNTFIPYFRGNFIYTPGFKYQTYSNFKEDIITEGFHGYINIALTVTAATTPASAVIQKNTKNKPTISIYPTISESLYLGKFIVPKGTIYCVNERNEIISNQIIYTGQYSNVWRIFDTNLKELWKEEYNNTLNNIVKHSKK